ncbi:DUF2970 domain-containing protein [Marinobacter sp. VGCF2001]|uniref:DUF2970 domain-containing protein n=1 Tax=Marinobacter sp. VGCF2001 TaxID=3417189 RepID=UPI003CF3550B
MSNNKNNTSDEAPRRPGVLKIMQSILAGALGVQSDKRRREDFSNQNPLPYIVAAVLFTAAFVGALILVVQLVLSGQ